MKMTLVTTNDRNHRTLITSVTGLVARALALIAPPASGNMKVESWDPATGTVSTIPSKTVKGGVALKLDLKPYETQLITIQ